MLDIIVTQRVHPGKEEEFESLIRQLERNTVEKDQGCLRYEWYRYETAQTYILVERWTSKDAAQAHLKADHFEALRPRFKECVPAPFTILRLTKL
jgi:quinol monooxygenase YgiN